MKRALVLLLFVGCVIWIPSVSNADAGNGYKEIFAKSDYIVRMDVASYEESNSPQTHYSPNGMPNGPVADPDQPTNWTWSRLSGFVIEYDQKKWVLTAGHGFINGGLHDIKKVIIYFRDGKKRPVEAELAGYSKRLDVAMIRFPNQDLVREVPAVPLGSSADLMVGQKVLSIGFPAPFPRNQIVTTGKVAALCNGINRGLNYPEMIVHDCIINSGSSGSPLLNLKAEVVGINIAFLTPQVPANSGWQQLMQDKFSVAIPIDDIKRALPFLQKGEVKYASVSLRVNFTGFFHQIELEAADLEMPLPREGLMVVGNIGLAVESGFQIGDIILTCDSVSVVDWQIADFYRRLYLEPDLTKEFCFEVDRKGAKVTVKLPLSKPSKKEAPD